MMRTFTAEQLKAILEKHAAYLRGEKEGEKADLSGDDLSGANLSWANLSYANLSYADLREANLREADLSKANLRYANLRYADLRYADLREADLSKAKQKISQLVFGPLRAKDNKDYWLYAVSVDGTIDITIGCFRGDLATYKASVARNGTAEGQRAIKTLEAFFCMAKGE